MMTFRFDVIRFIAWPRLAPSSFIKNLQTTAADRLWPAGQRTSTGECFALSFFRSATARRKTYGLLPRPSTSSTTLI